MVDQSPLLLLYFVCAMTNDLFIKGFIVSRM